MRLIIPILGKRKVDDDDFWEDVEELRQMTEKSIGKTVLQPPADRKRTPVLTTNTPTPTAANPEPGPSKEIKGKSKETRQELKRRLKRLKKEMAELKRRVKGVDE